MLVRGDMPVTSENLRLFSDALAELYAPAYDTADQGFPARVVNVAARLVPADSCSYNHFDGPHLLAWHAEPVGTGIFPGSEQQFRQHLPEHPVLACHLVTGDGRALRISDFLSDRQFRSLGLYCDFYRAAEVNYQLAITVPAPGGGLIGGQPDRGIARALGISTRTVQAHLQHAYRELNVTSRTEALARLQER
jgi:hypothetical protein